MVNYVYSSSFVNQFYNCYINFDTIIYNGQQYIS